MDRVQFGAWMVLALGACGGITVSPIPADTQDVPSLDAAVCALPGAPDVAPGVVVAAPPRCCSEAMCAPSATRCNPQTCRCEMVPCDALGEPCPAGAIPGVTGNLVCERDVGGLFCHVMAEEVSECPRDVSWCLGPAPCVCGQESCRYFLERCGGGKPCVPAGSWSVARGDATGTCLVGAPQGSGGLGAPCAGATSCAAGLLCVDEGVADTEPRCVRPDCGFAEGAPDCAEGRVCRPLGAAPLLGSCRLPCDPRAVRGPCGANERCLARAPGETGFCTVVSDAPLPGVGAACARWCATGATCVDGRCQPACHPGAAAGAPGACPSGSPCLTAGDQWYCARACNLFATFRECDIPEYCAPVVDTCGIPRGLCVARPADLPRFGEECARDCDTGLACPLSVLARCLPMCIPGVYGGTGACPSGSECFLTRPDAPYGVCARACTMGDEGCPEGTACNPLWSAPEADWFVGFCG